MDKFTGKDIMDLGYAPERWFGPALREIEDRRLSRSQAIRFVHEAKSAWDAKQPKTMRLQDGVDFIINMTPENENERDNMDKVVSGFRDLVRTPTVVAGAVMPDACPSEPGAIPVGGRHRREERHPPRHALGGHLLLDVPHGHRRGPEGRPRRDGVRDAFRPRRPPGRAFRDEPRPPA